MILSGQDVEITEGGNIKFHIKELYRSAGIKYGFPLSSPGVGINSEIIKEAENRDCNIFITIGESEHIYWISYIDVVYLADKYASIETHGSAKLYVIPVRSLKSL